MRKSKLPIQIASKSDLYNDFLQLYKSDKKLENKLIAKKKRKDAKEEKIAKKFFHDEFVNSYLKQEKIFNRKIKKTRIESKKINSKSKRKIIKDRIHNSVFIDKNHEAFNSKKQNFYLIRAVTITRQILDSGEFIQIIKINFEKEIIKFIHKFQKKKNKEYFFTLGYHFYFEGLTGNKTFESGYRPKEEMPKNLEEIENTLRLLLTDVIKRFQIYYTNAQTHLIKFHGISLEATE